MLLAVQKQVDSMLFRHSDSLASDRDLAECGSNIETKQGMSKCCFPFGSTFVSNWFVNSVENAVIKTQKRRKDFFPNAHLVYLVRNKGKKILLVKLVNRGLGSIVSYTKKIFILNCNLSNFCCMHFLLIRAFIYFHGKCILKHSLWG